MTKKDKKTIEQIFKGVDFSSNGGTENMVRELYQNLGHDALDRFEWIVSYPPQGFIKGEKPVILWVHDWVDDPAFNVLQYRDYVDQFDAFVFVSHIQAEGFRRKFNIPFSKSFVIKNAINPVEGVDIVKKFQAPEKIKITYTSMPHKGLPIVVDVFDALSKEYGDDVEFYIYSNFNVYGEKHEPRNERYKEIFDKLNCSDAIIYIAGDTRVNVIEHLKSSHIWVLPSMFPETSCLALIEAMSAGNVCVCNDFGALPETSSNFAMQYHFNEDININAGGFYEALKNTIETIKQDSNSVVNHVLAQKFYMDNSYSWNRRAREWNIFLHSFLNK